jgi:excisionase family DNA binding protein
MSSKILTVAGAAEATGLAKQTLYNMRSQGVGPKSFKLGRLVRYYEHEVDAWIAKQAGVNNVTPITAHHREAG